MLRGYWGLLCGFLLISGSLFAEITYNRDIAPIIQSKCQQCHRPNDIAPFAMMSYDDVKTWAEDIKIQVGAKNMPPWKPVAGYGNFRDSFAISDDERQMILDWIDAGAPEGDAADAKPAPPVSDSPWQLGEPDIIHTMPEYQVPRAPDTYRCFVLTGPSDSARFINAFQALPGDKQSVHHMILFIDSDGSSEKLQAATTDGQPGYSCFGGPGFDPSLNFTLGGWVPGARSSFLPEGIGMYLPAGARLVMQVHYHPNGRSAVDQTKVGLYYADPATIKNSLIYIPVVNTGFKIPANASNYQVTATLPAFFGATAISVVPHMHLLGRDIKVEVLDRRGNSTPLIYIDNWDFNWQNFYYFVDPVPIPLGSTVRVTAHFDNSENNPKNPNNPIVPVGWGEGTNDEMCIGFIGVTLDDASLSPFLKRNVRTR